MYCAHENFTKHANVSRKFAKASPAHEIFSLFACKSQMFFFYKVFLRFVTQTFSVSVDSQNSALYYMNKLYCKIYLNI